MHERKSESIETAHDHALYENEEQKVALVERNVLLQYDEIRKIHGESGGKLCLTPQIVKRLQFLAIHEIYACAGRYREWPVKIRHSAHVPPRHGFVPGLVENMCDTANSNEDWEPIKTAAYLMWRLNWIHPFGGGNGRTARAVSYLALCIRLGHWMPGGLPITEQIVNNRQPYQDALEDADAAWKDSNVVDVSKMEALLADLLERQLSFMEGDDSAP